MYEKIDAQRKIGPSCEVEICRITIVNVPIKEPDEVEEEEERAIDKPSDIVHPIRSGEDQHA